MPDRQVALDPANPTPFKAADLGDGTFGLTTSPAQIVSTTATHTRLTADTAPVILLAANTLRVGASLFNDSTAICYVKLGTAVTATSKWRALAAGAYVEIPFGYEGIIQGVWAAVNGAMDVVEFT